MCKEGSYLSMRQVDVLMKDMHPGRVQILDGFSHLEAFDVRACLNRVFGFGRWDEVNVDSPKLLYADPHKLKSGTEGIKVAYLSHRRLTVRSPNGTFLCEYEAAAVGESTMPLFKRGDAYDMALKTAESQALKRCAISLGCQFGLGLYADGSLKDPVKVCLVQGEDLSDELVKAVEQATVELGAMIVSPVEASAT
jgi:hypothetical protein